MRISSLLFLASLLAPGPGVALGDSSRPLKLAVVLQWEGRDLKQTNLTALKAFRGVFSDVNFVHLVSPAYFLRSDAEAGEARSKVRALMKPKDQIGVALGGWKSLASKAGVIFRGGPTFWGHTLGQGDCEVDCGVEVPVNIYPEKDVDALVTAALDTLEQQGFGRARGMTVEGWAATPEVMEAASRAGVRYDFSAVAPEMVAARAQRFPLYQWVKNLWTQVTPHTQPYVIPTTRSSVKEIPQSLAALDYSTPNEVLQVFKEYADILKKDPDAELTFPLVIYQETAHVTLPILAKVLQGIFAHAQGEGLMVEQLELPGLELPGALVADGFEVPAEEGGSRSLHEPMVH